MSLYQCNYKLSKLSISILLKNQMSYMRSLDRYLIVFRTKNCYLSNKLIKLLMDNSNGPSLEKVSLLATTTKKLEEAGRTWVSERECAKSHKHG